MAYGSFRPGSRSRRRGPPVRPPILPRSRHASTPGYAGTQVRRARPPAAGQHPGQPATGRHSALGRGTYAGHCRCNALPGCASGEYRPVGARRRASSRRPGGEPARRPSKSTTLPGDQTRPTAPLRHDRDQWYHLRHDRPSRRRHRPPGAAGAGSASHYGGPRPWSEPSPSPAHAQPLPWGCQQRLPAGAAHHRGGHGWRVIAGAQDLLSWSGAWRTGFCAPRRRRRCAAGPPACGPGARPQPARRRTAR